VAGRRGRLRWVAFIGYAFVVIGAFCLFLWFAVRGAPEPTDADLTGWKLLAVGVAFLLGGAILVLATKGWGLMVGTERTEPKQDAS
jgi:hypothetical protein